MLDQITHLFRLQAIIDAGSMRKASEVLNVTQPALTRSIALLEARFGQPLLDRHARGVRPTPFGLTVVRSAQRLARYWDIVDADLQSTRRSQANILRISAGPMWRAVVLPRIIGQLQADFPALSVELRNSRVADRREALQAGGVDVVFGGLQDRPLPDERLMTHEFTTVRDRIVAREDHPLFRTLAVGETIDPQRLLDFGWLIYDADPVYREITMHAMVESVGRAPTVRLICDSLVSAIRALQGSDLLCVLPDAALKGAVHPRILPLPVSLSRRAVPSGAMYRAEFADWPPLVALLALCEAHFQREA